MYHIPYVSMWMYFKWIVLLLKACVTWKRFVHNCTAFESMAQSHGDIVLHQLLGIIRAHYSVIWNWKWYYTNNLIHKLFLLYYIISERSVYNKYLMSWATPWYSRQISRPYYMQIFLKLFHFSSDFNFLWTSLIYIYKNFCLFSVY